MCNLLRYKDEIQEATGKFEEFSHIRIVPKLRYRVPPSEPAPVLRLAANGKAQIDMMNYGFRTGRGRQMMARSETAAEKDMWREPIQHRRCLVLVHGFYDNELIMKKVNQLWFFQRKGEALMVMAALWEESSDAENFAIMSCEPNTVVRRVIDRMPVILPSGAWQPWLDSQSQLLSAKATAHDVSG